MVVTEISTPTSAPDLADVSDSTPADPATKATKKLRKSGSEMNSVKGCWASLKFSGNTSTPMKTSVVRSATTIPTGKPTARASSERRASGPRRFTSATLTAASGPELRAHDHGARRSGSAGRG